MTMRYFPFRLRMARTALLVIVLLFISAAASFAILNPRDGLTGRNLGHKEPVDEYFKKSPQYKLPAPETGLHSGTIDIESHGNGDHQWTNVPIEDTLATSEKEHFRGDERCFPKIYAGQGGFPELSATAVGSPLRALIEHQRDSGTEGAADALNLIKKITSNWNRILNRSGASKYLHWQVESDQFTAETPVGPVQMENFAVTLVYNSTNIAKGMTGPTTNSDVVAKPSAETDSEVTSASKLQSSSFKSHTKMNTTSPAGLRKRSEERPPMLTVAAHFDTLRGVGTEFRGAIDAAGSVALLLHIGNAITRAAVSGFSTSHGETIYTQKKLRQVQLLFFDGEEAFVKWSSTDSAYGSTHFVTKYESSPLFNGYNPNDLFVLLDLLGARSGCGTIYPLQKSTINDYWALREASLELERLGELESGCVNKWFVDPEQYAEWAAGTSIDDDHREFLKRGSRVLQLTPLPFPSEWHTSNDNVDALNEPALRDWARILDRFIYQWVTEDCGLDDGTLQKKNMPVDLKN